MDIWGVQGVEAEAELLSAIVTSFKDMGIGPEDVGIKINSRKILTGLMASLGVPEDKFAPTCVLVDKLEKVPLDAIQGDLEALGLTRAIVEELVSSLQVSTGQTYQITLKFHCNCALMRAFTCPSCDRSKI
jgi:histidyl-tRNA synthetase